MIGFGGNPPSRRPKPLGSGPCERFLLKHKGRVNDHRSFALDPIFLDPSSPKSDTIMTLTCTIYILVPIFLLDARSTPGCPA